MIFTFFTFAPAGGTGAVGGILARWLLLDIGVAHVQLVSRSGMLPSSLLDLLQISSEPQCKSTQDIVTPWMLTSSKVDTCAAEDVQVVSATGLPVRGILHAAGVLADGLLAHQSAARVRAVVAPKMNALRALVAPMHGKPLCTQVLFSSVAALLGSPGQANYAAANAGMDAMAGQLNASGSPAVSVQWGAWAGGGMAAADVQTAARAARVGLGLLQPFDALSVLEVVLSGAVPLLAALPVDWQTLVRRMPPSLSFFSSFDIGAAASSMAVGPLSELQQGQPSSGLVEVTAAAAARQQPLDTLVVETEQAVRAAVISILGEEPEPEAPLMTVGLDSLGAVELRNTLQQGLRLQLPPTVVLDHPTLMSLSRFITDQVLQQHAEVTASDAGAAINPPAGARTEVQVSPTLSIDAAPSGALTVLALASRVPCSAANGNSVDGITVVPLTRWDVDQAHTSCTAARCAEHVDEHFTWRACWLGG